MVWIFLIWNSCFFFCFFCATKFFLWNMMKQKWQCGSQDLIVRVRMKSQPFSLWYSLVYSIVLKTVFPAPTLYYFNNISIPVWISGMTNYYYLPSDYYPHHHHHCCYHHISAILSSGLHQVLIRLGGLRGISNWIICLI